jgi:predicted CXXCH cytochrome family protein
MNRIIQYCFFCLLLSTIVIAQTSIKDNKHNLSVGSTVSTIKAQSEQEICVFCHTPHNSSTTAQLWNHQPTTATYTLYSSEFLTSRTYAAPGQPNQKSKLCLSCHDGTIALGSVINTVGGGSSGTITMGGGITTLPAGSGNLGTTFVDDHPIGFGYDNTKDPELVVRTWPWSGSVKLDPNLSTGKIECITCHDPHNNQYSHFLQMSNTNAALCEYCHNKNGWNASIHKTSPQAYTPAGGVATTIAEWSCRNCHKPHSGTGIPYNLSLSEENTCYQSGCHGTINGVNTKDIQSVMNKTYRHPTNATTGKHKNPDNTTSLSSPNRHAECQDCHDPHQAKDGLHALKSNAVSNVLTGASGLTPNSAAIWTQPTTFTTANPVTTENQICFKCHSYNGLGVVVNGVSTIMGPSGTNITDQAMEYNPANKSAHPVQVSSNNQTGSGAPKPLATAQMATAWNGVGTQSMYCSDCHGNDQTVSATVPDGPHGSSRKYMLKGTTAKPSAQYWPYNATGTTLWRLNDVRSNLNSWSTNLFCVSCHPLITGTTWYNNAHKEHETRSVTIGGVNYGGIPCVSCHTTVPHGSKRSRLITYSTDVAPYAHRDGAINVNVILGFKKATGPNAYSKSNCYSTQSGCTTHSNAGGFDP